MSANSKQDSSSADQSDPSIRSDSVDSKSDFHASNDNLPQPGKESKTSPAAGSGRKKIQIGSQRDTANVALKPSQPLAVKKAIDQPVELKAAPPEPVPVISTELLSNADAGDEVEAGIQIVEPISATRQPEAPQEHVSNVGLGDDIESEIEAVLGGISMETIADQIQFAETELELEPNSRIKGSITKIHGENVFVSLKGRFEGVVPRSQFKKMPEEGQLAEFVVKGVNSDDGLYELSIPGSAVDIGDWEDLAEGEVVDAVVSGSNTGGLEVRVKNIRGFIPASQIDRVRVENFGDYVNQKLRCVVTEVNPGRKRLVLSHRAVLEREAEAQRNQLLAEIQPGQLRDGIVTKLADFGAFVDVGGIEGLLHISKLSWDRVTHPREILEVGQRIKVKIEKISKESGKLSLSHRDTLDDPWKSTINQFQPNQIVKGRVTRTAQFGAFVRLAPGIEGLVHISELAYHRVLAVKNVVNEGDEIEVKILSIDPDAQKISLSLKATQAPPAPKTVSKVDEPESDPLRPPAVRHRSQPLKGGTDRKSGGEGVGLNW